MQWRVALWAVVFATATFVDARAETAQQASDATAALAGLQAEQNAGVDRFVAQEVLDPLISPDGGGACATAAAIDLLQGLRVIAGMDPLANPHKVALSFFKEHPDLLKGRVSNATLTELVHGFGRHLDTLEVRVSLSSSPTSPYRHDTPTWDRQKGPQLDVPTNGILFLSYQVTDPKKGLLGRHFVLLQKAAGNEITVLDPNSPLKPRTYLVDIQEPSSPDQASRIYLLNPPTIKPRSLVFELDTVFTTTLNGLDNGNRPGAATAADVERVKLKITETAARLKARNRFHDPRAWREETASIGLPGLDLPRELGGTNWPAEKMIDIFRHAGRYDLNLRDVVGGGHARALAKSRNDEVRSVVREVAEGKAYVAILLTEPQAGSDFGGFTTRAESVDGGYRIFGEKRYNARLEQATQMLVFARAGADRKLSAFLLPVDADGVEVLSLKAHGLTGNSFGGAKFHGAFVPNSHRIGDAGNGMAVFFDHFLYWRLMQAAAAIGTGEAALDMMAERMKTRHVNGGPIGRFTHLQQQLGQHTAELRMAYALAREAAIQLDQDDSEGARETVSAVKAEAIEMALQAADDAMRAHGGMGYSNEVDLGDRVRDLMGLRIADGATDVMRSDVVRQHYGDVFWEMAVGAEH